MQVFLFLNKGIEYISTNLTIDDSYYYINSAWNHKSFGYPSFDNINNTNGIHFLWYKFLYLLSFLFKSKITFLFSALFSNILFNVFSYFFIYKIGKTLKSSKISILLALSWFAISLPPLNNINGMESSLHALIFWALASAVLSFFNNILNNQKVNLPALAIILCLNYWVRIEYFVMSTLIYGLCIIYLTYKIGFRKLMGEYAKDILVSIIIFVLGIAIPVLFYWNWGGTFLPLTATIKRSPYFPFAYKQLTNLSRLRLIYKQSFPFTIPFSQYLAFSSLISFFALNVFLLKKKDKKVYSLTITSSVFIASLFFYICLLLIAKANEFGYWYFSPVRVIWLILFSTVIYFFIKLLTGPAKNIALYIFCFIFLFSGVKNYYQQYNKQDNLNHLYGVRYRCSKWISENISSDSIIASWNAGQLGFFSNCRVINLDGLINNKYYFENVMQGKISLSQYLRDNGVDYVVDYRDFTQDLITQKMPVIKTFGPIMNFPTEYQYINIYDFKSVENQLSGGFYKKYKL